MASKAGKSIVVLLALLLLASAAFAAVKTFRVQETDFVRVLIDSLDLDGDIVSYNFSAPLDSAGEWQTDYNDAGEYEVDVTASDGQGTTSKKIRIIVGEKNQPPELLEKRLTVKEGQTADLKSLVGDPENDPLLFDFPAPFTSQGLWETGYEDEGQRVIVFTASDGEFTEKFQVEIIVLHSNQAPTIEKTIPWEEIVSSTEEDTLEFSAEARDDSGSDLQYTWQLDSETISTKPFGEYPFSFDDAGEHNLSVEISDGERTTKKIWAIVIQDVNRKPDLKLQPLSVYEHDAVKLELPQKDADGDQLTYEFSAPFDEEGRWLPGYDEAGEYKIEIKAFDGKEKTTGKVDITILNLDRPPTLDLPEEIQINEGDSFTLPIDSIDPDEEDVRIAVTGLPEGATLDDATVSWNPGYDLIQRRGGFFSEILNALRLEHSFLSKKEFPMTVTSCGSELCTKKDIFLVLENTNRPPIFPPVKSITILETEELHLQVNATDPDGDIIRYYFSEPLGKRNGKWKTSYTDSGRYNISITASDGSLEETKLVPLTVRNNNRLPAIHVPDDHLVVNEFQQFSVQVTADDPDQENLTVGLRKLPAGAAFSDGWFVWEPGAQAVKNKTDTWKHRVLDTFPFLNKKLSDDQATIWLEFVASDQEVDVVQPVQVVVKNVNQPPQLLDYLPLEEITVRAFEPILFHVAAADSDGDLLLYTWKFGLGEKPIQGTDTIERTFITPGKKKIEVTISDGREKISREFVVNVVQEEYVPPASARLEPISFKVYVIKG